MSLKEFIDSKLHIHVFGVNTDPSKFRCACNGKWINRNYVRRHCLSKKHVQFEQQLRDMPQIEPVEERPRSPLPLYVFNPHVGYEEGSNNFIDVPPTDCGICYEEQTVFSECYECKNKICTDCFSKIFQSNIPRCPFCRERLISPKYVESLWVKWENRRRAADMIRSTLHAENEQHQRNVLEEMNRHQRVVRTITPSLRTAENNEQQAAERYMQIISN